LSVLIDAQAAVIILRHVLYTDVGLIILYSRDIWIWIVHIYLLFSSCIL